MDTQIEKKWTLEELEALLQAIPGLLFIQNRDGVYTNYHATDPSLLFVSPEKFLGKNMRDVLPLPLADQFRKAFEQIFTDYVPICIEYSQEMSREVHYFEARISSFGTNQVMTIVRDITDKKKIEAEVHKLSTAIEQSPISIIITDKTGAIEYVNRYFKHITGYTEKEVIGQNSRILKSGEQSADVYTRLWQTITSGRHWSGEFHNKKKSGELYWEKATISPIVDGSGAILNYVAIKEDVTAQKLSDGAAKKHTDELERMNSLMIGRELRMAEIKKELDQLKKET